VHMELCRLMRAVILALKNCTRKIVQQNDNNLKSDGTFLIEVGMSRDHLPNPNPYYLLNI
jgi:hypothetical protein